MGAGLRTPTVALAVLSICLCSAVIGYSGKTISYFHSNKTDNVWLLPIWPNHFDLRELYALVGTSAAIILLNSVLLLSVFVSALPANAIVFVSTLLSTIASIIAIAITTTINNAAPTKDTLQSWTCRWSTTEIWSGQGPPSEFGSMCQETRFVFYAAIPIFVLQLLLLCISLFAVSTAGNSHHPRQPGARRYDVEKSTSQHELGQVRQLSFETKSESPRSMHVTAGKGTKGVQFA